MQAKSKPMRWADNDESQSGAGPGGRPLEPLAIDHARALIALYTRGAARALIDASRVSPGVLTRMRQLGLVETAIGVQGRTAAQITARGLQHVVEAYRTVREAPASAPAL